VSNPLTILNGRATIHIGNVMDRLRDLPDDFFDTCVTSPPYWGLRDYGTAAWVGGDSTCHHQPVATMRMPWANGMKSPTSVGKHGWHGARPPKERHGYCALCGAQRVDYQIGLESTLGEHLEVMVEVFAEIWRVMKPTGTVFLNYGDCYATAPNGRSAADTKVEGNDDRTFRDKPFSTVGPIYDPNWATPRGVFEGSQFGHNGAGTRRIDHGGRVVAGGMLKPKDLCMIPNRLAIALQDWGWWVRSEIIWGKKNPMPDSSGNGRPSTAHEKIFLLTKSGESDVWRARDTGALSFNPDLNERVPMATAIDKDTGLPKIGPRWIKLGSYYDASAVMQPSSENTHSRISQNVEAQIGSERAHAGGKTNGNMKAVASKIAPAHAAGHRANSHFVEALKTADRRSIRGGNPKHVDPRHAKHINHTGLDSLDRGRGRLLRNFEEAPLTVWPIATVAFKDAHFATFPPELVALAIAAGAPPNGGMVLDPFGGSGTTALVALRMGRKAHLIELKPEYAAMARNRLERDWMGEEERRRVSAKDKGTPPPGPLFEVVPAEAAE
jgi:DNA modification methylase